METGSETMTAMRMAGKLRPSDFGCLGRRGLMLSITEYRLQNTNDVIRLCQLTDGRPPVSKR